MIDDRQHSHCWAQIFSYANVYAVVRHTGPIRVNDFTNLPKVVLPIPLRIFPSQLSKNIPTKHKKMYVT